MRPQIVFSQVPNSNSDKDDLLLDYDTSSEISCNATKALCLKHRIINSQADQWIAPNESGAGLLTMPNIPLPVHRLAPRTVLAPEVWIDMRRRCLERAGNKCEICGAENSNQAHELYDIDYAHQFVKFRRCVCLCELCHMRCIHNGRALSMYKRGDPEMTKEKLIEGAEHAFRIIHEYNSTHRSSEPLRAFSTWINYMKQPGLEEPISKLIKQYEMQFYFASQKCYDEEHWSNWRLIIGNMEFPTPYKTWDDWKACMNLYNAQEQIIKSVSPSFINNGNDHGKGSEYDYLRTILRYFKKKDRIRHIKHDNRL